MTNTNLKQQIINKLNKPEILTEFKFKNNFSKMESLINDNTTRDCGRILVNPKEFQEHLNIINLQFKTVTESNLKIFKSSIEKFELSNTQTEPVFNKEVSLDILKKMGELSKDCVGRCLYTDFHLKDNHIIANHLKENLREKAFYVAEQQELLQNIQEVIEKFF